ncbi:26S proteasome, regulatory subunit Rpn7,Proteasome component (PCI) domain protein [Artemisia annua]|uniref:26S proteasome, regulatory subunit Rpn7,Proteasome component (PCI) domain protein n=1 Tax=Artemisia annua TaxID=35608 RepID=A0A2U1PVV0_ARTAN|nr:26S proteasome, regulatory subunit Rpn7,Proteasome component (PCI) domain protein [Artemisia annua]
MSTRNFKKAADLFLDSISTFTTYEIFPYDTFIFYTVLGSIMSLDRVSLKEKVGHVKPERIVELTPEEMTGKTLEHKYHAFMRCFNSVWINYIKILY